MDDPTAKSVKKEAVEKTGGMSIVLNIGLLVSGAILAAVVISLNLMSWRNERLYNSEIKNYIEMTAETIAGRLAVAMSISGRDEAAGIVATSIGDNQQIADCMIIRKKDSTVFYDIDKSREGKKYNEGMKKKGLEYVEAPIVSETGFGFGLETAKEKIGLLMLGVRHENFIQNEHIRSKVTFARNISRDVAGSIESGSLIEVRDFMENMISSRRNIVYAELMHADGKILFYSNARFGRAEAQKKEGRIEESEPGKKAIAVSAARPILIQNLEGPKGEPILDIAVPVLSGKEKLGVVRLGYSMSGFLAERKRSMMLLAVTVAVLALLGLVFSVWVSIRMTKPIRILAEAASLVGEGNLNQKVEIHSGGRETRELGRSFNRMIAGLKERDMVKDTFSRYVTKQVADEILKTPEKIILGGKKQEVTILFSDIRGFTSFSESNDPELVVSHLNEYLSAMLDVIFKYEGTLDKFIGDAIMAVFGSPLSHEDDPMRAAKTALEMQERLVKLNNKWREEGKEQLKIGIGINTGEVIVGNIGDVRRMEYTVIGDNVNLASRIEGLTKNFDCPIIISASTYSHVIDDVLVRKMETVTVKGKSTAVEVYELLQLKS